MSGVSVPGPTTAGRSRHCCGSPVHLAAALVLSLAAVALFRSNSITSMRPNLVSKGNTGLRRAVASPSILPACPPINYNEPSCQPDRLHAPRTNITDAELFEDMYHGFECLQKAVMEPWASGAPERGLSVTGGTQHPSSGSRQFRCGREGGSGNGGQPSPFRVSQDMAWENGWRAMAEEQLCMIAHSMYDAMLYCHHGLRRGMHVHTSGELLWRLSNERRCPAGLAVCAVVKNEAAYVQEWLAFHLHSGVQHFHLYLNDDEEGTLTALKPFIEAGFVTVETIEGGGVQGQAYDRCFRRVKEGQLAEWLALIDVDEYLFLGGHGCLMDYVQHLDDRAALTVKWRTYLPSNQILPVPPDRLLIESNVYTRADDAEIGMDRQVKSIVHVNRTVSCRDAHYCIYEEGWSAKDEWRHVVQEASNSFFPFDNRVHLHHYPMRSYIDYLMKRLRQGQGRAEAVDLSVDFDDISINVGMAARMASVRENIQPAIGPVRRILGLQ